MPKHGPDRPHLGVTLASLERLAKHWGSGHLKKSGALPAGLFNSS